MTNQVNDCTHPFIEPFNVVLDQFTCSVCKKAVNSDRKELNLCYVMGKLSRSSKILQYLVPIVFLGWIGLAIWLECK